MGSVQQQNGDSKTALPAILCLHGGGSTATVFKIQTRRLQWNLGKQFRFVFPQAPIEGSPGTGMLPVFASCAPFYRWVSRRFKINERGDEMTPEDEVKVIDDIILKAMEENGGVDSFVGVIGFSQGARLTAGLLLRQRLEEQQWGSSRWKFKFGVVIGGPFPPISVHSGDLALDYNVLKNIPTLHAWGRDDFVGDGSKAMADACDSPDCFVFHYDGGHHLPLKDKEAKELCGLIVEAWHASGGTSG